MWRRWESWRTHRWTVALQWYLLAWIALLGIPSCGSQSIERAFGVCGRIRGRMVLLLLWLPWGRVLLVLLGRDLVLLCLLPRRTPSLVVIRFWRLSFVFEGVTVLILHRGEGGSEVVLLPNVSALSRISWNWPLLARRNGSASTRGHRSKVNVPSEQEQYCGGRLRIVRFSRNQVCAPEPKFVQNKKTRRRQMQKWRCRSILRQAGD